MATDLNQAIPSTKLKGSMMFILTLEQLAVEIDSASSATLTSLQAAGMTLVDKVGPRLIVDKAGDTDDIWGFVKFNHATNSYTPGQIVELVTGGMMYMEASAAIARGAQVMIVPASNKIAVATTGKTIIGTAVEKATADGDIIGVDISHKGKVSAA